MTRHGRSIPGRSRGFILITILTILSLGALYLLLDQFSPLSVIALKERKTDAALRTARDALLGYMVRYREDQNNDGNFGRPYGYSLLPDLGSSRNNNITCTVEGCDAAAFSGIAYDANGLPPTVIGRFPWRTLGTGPIRDGDGECLWLIVSSTHGRIQRTSPAATPPAMNWDTTSQLDIVIARGTTALASEIASAHDRPLAIIYAPGPPLSGQDRSSSQTDNVTECGGNYSVANYLDPATVTALGGVTNYFAGATNQASGDTSSIKSFSAQGVVQRRSTDATLWRERCPSGGDCTPVANDRGLTLTPDQLFKAVRNSGSFRSDINTLLERMVGCLRDQIASGAVPTPTAMSGISTPPADKNVGKAPAANPCFSDTTEPLGYYSNYADMILFAACTPASNCFAVTKAEDGSVQNCPAALLFAAQRGTGQYRSTAAERGTPANYLEGGNLATFTQTGVTAFSGPSVLAAVSASQSASQDILRCIPAGASISTVQSPSLTAAQQLVAYDAVTRTLTLGKPNVDSTHGVNSTALFGCAWLADEASLSSGFRSYFKFSFATVGTGVGNTGFVFALIDTENNTSLPCGKAGTHLGYSGDNGATPRLREPKLGIEFDQSRDTGFSESAFSTSVGRNDPCGTSFCASPAVGYNSHVGIVYWGHDQGNATDHVSRQDDDDNVHGFPSSASYGIGVIRKPPTNPNAAPGLQLFNLRTGGQEFHVRVEVTPTRNAVAAPAENSKVSMLTKVWVLLDSPTNANQIAAMKNTARPMNQLYPGFAETLSDTANVYDVAVSGTDCSATPCGTNQTCGSDNICYRQGLRKVRLGFTNSQRTQDQQVTISDIITTWLP